MTLIVAHIDGESISIVSDTKLTFGNDVTRTRRTFENAIPKIVLLSRTQAIAFAGDVTDNLLASVLSLRGRTTPQILDGLRDLSRITFVVADLNAARLWAVGDGTTEERTGLRRAWAGSRAAYEVFKQREAEWPQDDPVATRLTTSMQFLTSFDVVDDVGGYTLTATGSQDSGFVFLPGQQTTFPAMFDGFSFDPAQVVVLRQLAGTGVTFGALGLWLANVGRGLLFTHEEPWIPVSIDAQTATEFAATAFASHGQSLAIP